MDPTQNLDVFPGLKRMFSSVYFAAPSIYPRSFEEVKSKHPNAYVSRHFREAWVAGQMRCFVEVNTGTPLNSWVANFACTEHPPLVGKRYEKPAVVNDCGEYECCTDHEQERKRLVAMFELGREHGSR